MSIIYDALQKTQKNRELKNKVIINPLPQKKIPVKQFKIILIAAIAALLSITTLFYFFHSHSQNKMTSNVENKFADDSTSAALTQVSDSNANSPFILNGIFVSDQSKMAMINHHIYKVGDMIDEMKVISISQKTVTLAKGKEVVTLTSAI